MKIIENRFYSVECKEVNSFTLKPNFETIEKLFGFEFRQQFSNIGTNNIEILEKHIKNFEKTIFNKIKRE